MVLRALHNFPPIVFNSLNHAMIQFDNINRCHVFPAGICAEFFEILIAKAQHFAEEEAHEALAACPKTKPQAAFALTQQTHSPSQLTDSVPPRPLKECNWHGPGHGTSANQNP